MYVVSGTVIVMGAETNLITVRENWGLRVVIRSPTDGSEQIVWGKDLRRCSENPHTRVDPYGTRDHNKWNRDKLRKVKKGTVVEHLVYKSAAAPAGCAKVKDMDAVGTYVQSQVIRVIRAGCWRDVEYSVGADRCIHDRSVKVTKRMLTRARKDNRLWGSGMRAPVTVTEKHIVSPATYKHLRDWIFDTDFLEQLKATEQSTQRGHCFAIREAWSETWVRYKKDAAEKGVPSHPLSLTL